MTDRDTEVVPGTPSPGAGPDPDGGRAHVVGGKGANLLLLSDLDGVRVPSWCCVTTVAYRRAVAETPAVGTLLDALEVVAPGDAGSMRHHAAAIRREIERVGVPDDLADAIGRAVDQLGDGTTYAVRSSATAEDLPDASFAGQHDSYLHVVGLPAILRAVARCWASLFTERAVAYRSRMGIDHRQVEMAVLVQRMVVPRASGVLFTADPGTGDRTVAAIEATLGLGEALVSGTADADAYRVRDGRVVQRAVAVKPTVVLPSPGGGLRTVAVGPCERTTPALSDEQVLTLTALGRRIEAALGYPQDIEWAIDDEGIHVLQARPITTLFPVPETSDEGTRVYVSVGHQQMMTDPMTPLGLSVWQLTSRAPMRVAGGRLFVDVTAALSAPATRAATLDVLGRSDPLLGDALRTVLERADVLEGVDPDVEVAAAAGGERPAPSEVDPSVVGELIERARSSLAELERTIRAVSGPAVFTTILDDLEELRGSLFDPPSQHALSAGFEAARWLDDTVAAWLGERGPTDVLSRAAPGNVTAAMGLALLDVADAVRPHPEVVAALRAMDGDDGLDRLAEVDGGAEARDAILAYLDEYGMRCIGEIDIARPRWRERPAALVPAILSNVDHLQPGERERRLARGRDEARQQAEELVERIRALPGGEEKAAQTERMIAQLRAFVGYREYPKYAMVCRYAVYREALLAEAARLVADGVLDTVDDATFLTFEELGEVVRSGHADLDLVARRRQQFRTYAALTPPRVLTSDGEVIHGAYRRDDVPPGALVGLAVSSGVVEGRARVVRDVAEAELGPGDVLVTRHTDPSWSPVFVVVAGLVTEVGGLTTHGAVIAREYGLAAVVGVERATERIRDGQRIRVDGTRGLVELLPDADGTSPP